MSKKDLSEGCDFDDESGKNDCFGCINFLFPIGCMYYEGKIDMEFKMKLPHQVDYVLDKLIKAGHKAYVVGGCVRDKIMNIEPHDYDICTSAEPNKVKELFKRTILTGEKHGTVTAIVGDMEIEITTYRTDGEYLDGRRPETVEFSSNLREDLKRRDFTINAMAYNHEDGLIDLFGGREDIKNRTINPVGNAEDRIKEDYLRAMRAVRFSSQLDFLISDNLYFAIAKNSDLIYNVSNERIRDEFNKIMISENVVIGIKYLDSLGLLDRIIPELKDLKTTFQNHPCHIGNSVWEHTLFALDVISNNTMFRDSDYYSNYFYIIEKLAILFHDISKHLYKTTDENMVDHFYEHAIYGSAIAESIMRRMKYENKMIETVKTLIFYHDYQVEPTKKSVKRLLSRIGAENFEHFCNIRFADISAQNKLLFKKRIEKIIDVIEIRNEIKELEECFQIKDLEINGNDLIELGVKEGKQIGFVLKELLDFVIEDSENNTKEVLKNKAREIKEYNYVERD